MNWLLNMFSSFSETVMGDDPVFERERKKRRPADRLRKGRSRPARHQTRRRRDEFSDLDW